MGRISRDTRSKEKIDRVGARDRQRRRGKKEASHSLPFLLVRPKTKSAENRFIFHYGRVAAFKNFTDSVICVAEV